MNPVEPKLAFKIPFVASYLSFRSISAALNAETRKEAFLQGFARCQKMEIMKGFMDASS